MKYFVMYVLMLYVVACADSVDDLCHSTKNRVLRGLFWPITLTNWFITGNMRLHRLLNILWCMLISGWLLSLLADRL